MPLAEARKIGCPVIAPDKQYSREILINYSNLELIDISDLSQITAAIMVKISNE
ncbi:hypothetical protein IPL68_07390 [Candidatus Saccharibacteria bacterium]|nr:MAG: hypothetical protein IPL68_07390 [Candidatus Saccharibacteria bacterium]